MTQPSSSCAKTPHRALLALDQLLDDRCMIQRRQIPCQVERQPRGARQDDATLKPDEVERRDLSRLSHDDARIMQVDAMKDAELDRFGWRHAPQSAQPAARRTGDESRRVGEAQGDASPLERQRR
jgi:hypothetical protein